MTPWAIAPAMNCSLLAERIRRVLRHNDVAARLGGDEFLVLILL